MALIYGSEGWGFESLRARPGQRAFAAWRAAFRLTGFANTERRGSRTWQPRAARRIAPICAAPLWFVRADKPHRRGPGGPAGQTPGGGAGNLAHGWDRPALPGLPRVARWRLQHLGRAAERQDQAPAARPRTTILVAESDPPLRAVEVRGGRALSRRACPRPRCAS